VSLLTYSPVDKYAEVPYEEKERLFLQVTADARYPDYLYGCYECGICVAVCPSARFYDFSPRKIAQTLSREDIPLFYEHLNDSVWDCSQCFSCVKCPRGNNPGGLITIMREVAVRNGLKSAKQALEGYSRIIYKIMSTGTQVSPDMIRADAFPDWGPTAKETGENLELWRRAMPPDTMHTTSTSWEVSEKTLAELYLIWHLTGVMDMIKTLNENLYMILMDVMEEKLEEAGYSVTNDEQ
jgi:heterodisulfide reductase subunit C